MTTIRLLNRSGSALMSPNEMSLETWDFSWIGTRSEFAQPDRLSRRTIPLRTLRMVGFWKILKKKALTPQEDCSSGEWPRANEGVDNVNVKMPYHGDSAVYFYQITGGLPWRKKSTNSLGAWMWMRKPAVRFRCELRRRKKL